MQTSLKGSVPDFAASASVFVCNDQPFKNDAIWLQAPRAAGCSVALLLIKCIAPSAVWSDFHKSERR
jgi:hypothetical protein